MLEKNEELLKWLQGWYLAQYNSKLGNNNEILIETIDNPGWMVSINLKETICSGKELSITTEEVDDLNWKHYWVEDDIFLGRCGPKNLVEILAIFKNFVGTGLSGHKLQVDNDQKYNGVLLWLENWYMAQCDDFWEQSYGITIKTLSMRGWRVQIDLNDTYLSGKQTTLCKFKLNENDWIHHEVYDNKFEATCSSQNLLKVLEIFKKWAESFNM